MTSSSTSLGSPYSSEFWIYTSPYAQLRGMFASLPQILKVFLPLIYSFTPSPIHPVCVLLADLMPGSQFWELSWARSLHPLRGPTAPSRTHLEPCPSTHHTPLFHNHFWIRGKQASSRWKFGWKVSEHDGLIPRSFGTSLSWVTHLTCSLASPTFLHWLHPS